MDATDHLQRIRQLEAEVERLRSERDKARRSEQHFLDALRLSPMALCHHDRELRYTWLYNGHMGFVQEDVIGKTDWDILDRDLAERMGVVKRRVLETGVGERVEMPTVIGDPDCEYFDLVVEPLLDPNSGEVTGLACSGIDVTEDRRRREAYRASEENLRLIFDASPIPVTVTGLTDHRPLFFNAAAERLFRLQDSRADSPDGATPFEQLGLETAVEHVRSSGQGLKDHLCEFKRNAKPLFLSVNVTRVYFHGQAALLSTFNDLTKHAQEQKRLKKARIKAELLANTDEITGLYNRRALYTKGSQLLAQNQRGGDALSLILLDIDHFKRVNDSWGHDAGDKGIQALARLLKQSLRSDDIAARYGGEEFALLLPGTDLDGACIFAEKLRERIAAMKIKHQNQAFSITASFGVAERPPGTESMVRLLKQADLALYDAKAAGRNCVKHRLHPCPRHI